jgi:hypothetical protein
MMKTITLQIGNSDGKLTQGQWAAFVQEIRGLLGCLLPGQLHFFGVSAGYEEWQNAAWVFNTDEGDWIKDHVEVIRAKYHQDSAAWTEGETSFI